MSKNKKTILIKREIELRKNKISRFLFYKINKYEYLYFWIKAFKYSTAQEKRKVLTNQINLFRVEKKGDLLSEKNIYLISIESTSGFFALFRQVIAGLYISERYGFEPVVNYKKCIYKDNEIINRSNNPWEYYFLQPSDIKITEAMNCRNYFIHLGSDSNFFEQSIMGKEWKSTEGYTINENLLIKSGQLVSKYIKLNETIKRKIEQDLMKINFTDKILGVHVRGTDYALGLKGHPVYIDSDDYIENIKKDFLFFGFSKIFLATDDLKVLEKFQMIFGEKLVYYKDVLRTKKKINVSYLNSNRKHQHYLAGYEVLRDVYTLAHCNGLLAGISQVSISARIYKYSFNKTYEYLKIIDKGIIN